MRKDIILAHGLALSLLGFYAACATSGAGIPAGGPPPAQASATPDVSADEAAVQSALAQLKGGERSGDYRIRSEDVVEVTVFQQTEFDRSIRVSQNGTILLPLIGTVKVGGLSLDEAGAAIAGKLKEFIINPQVTVTIKEYGTRKVFVLGQVSKPGPYDIPPESGLTVTGAIAAAGGLTPIAAPDRTRVVRSVGGKKQVIQVQVSSIMSGEKENDVKLEPNDVIFVPQSYF